METSSFMDLDLREWKEVMEFGCYPQSTGLLKALIARLEAAEAIVNNDTYHLQSCQKKACICGFEERLAAWHRSKGI